MKGLFGLFGIDFYPINCLFKVRNGTDKVAEHTFTSGVPTSGGESIHIDLYAFGKARVPMQNPAEVVIENFTYTP